MINSRQIDRDPGAGELVSTGSTGVGGGSTNGSGSTDIVRELCAAADPATLAGSLLAAPAAERAAYAARLAAAGAWVHVDLIDHAYPLGAGVSPDLLAELDDFRERVDVHLLVSDPLEMLAGVLVHRPARVTIQLENVPAPRGPRLAEAARACAVVGTDLWVGIAPQTALDAVDEVRSAVGGVLVMLAEPGRAGTVAEPALVSRAAALQELPCGVDGGVTERAFVDLNSAGVDHIVMGRRLWALANSADDTDNLSSSSLSSGEDADDQHSRKRSKR